MSRIKDYPRVQEVDGDDVVLLDAEDGTKSILVKSLVSTLPFFSELSSATTLSQQDLMIIGSDDQNKKIPVSDLLFEMIDSLSGITSITGLLPLKRSFWRGKNLGTQVTNEQYQHIEDGTFRGMFLGDYWIIDGIVWRIVDFDYWLNFGDSACLIHHLVIMPDGSLGTGKMNDTQTTVGAYLGSKMYTTNLNGAKIRIYDTFNVSNYDDRILVHKELFQNAVSNDGVPYGGAWTATDIDIPSETMIFGSYIYAPANYGSGIGYRGTASMGQLAGIRVNRQFINSSRQRYWLRDVANSSKFCSCDGTGSPDMSDANVDNYLRPVFGLCRRNEIPEITQ